MLLPLLQAVQATEPEIVEPRVDESAVQVKFLLAWGKKGSRPGEFHSPIGIAINEADEIFVSDTHNHRVQKFNTTGKFLAAFDVPRASKGGSGGGIAVDRQDRIYVSLMASHEVAAFSPDGKLLREWGRRGSADGEFIDPGGVAIGPDGNVYVADQTNHRVQKFTPEGKFLGKWGEFGDRPGQFGAGKGPHSKARFGGPHFLAFDSHGNVFTTEGSMRRVQKLTADGKPLLAWGNDSTEPGGFGGPNKMFPGPIGLCVDRRDRVWVGGTFHRVQLYSPTGKYLAGLGLEGEGAEPGRFSVPHGLVVDSKGCLYVVDSRNQRVQKFDVIERKPNR